MKIIYKKGDVTEAAEGIIAHGCNALGVMGSGVAKAIRAKFPEAYQEYVAAHKEVPLCVGEVILVQSQGKYIANLITQATTCKYPGEVVVNYHGIYTALVELNGFITAFDLDPEVAFPRIGAGLGGGNWRIIEAMIEETSIDYQPYVYDFEG